MENQVAMTRNRWEWREHFLNEWRNKDITVLITQRKTKNITQLCLESLLQYYPDIPVLIVDGNSNDDSLLYIKWMAVKNPNVKVWERPNGDGFSSHGETMDAAMWGHITTKYVLLMDSDTIVERGGWIEPMLEKMAAEDIFALGSLMLVSKKGEAIFGVDPNDPNDTLRYAHPSCSILDREKYMEICGTNTHWPDGQIIPNRASNHGSPLVWTMFGADKLGFKVEYYPVDKYVSHLSGASWVGWEGDKSPKTIWPHDHDVKLRPFVTFLLCSDVEIPNQKDSDYQVIYPSWHMGKNPVIIHGKEPVEVWNQIYELRFNCHGEYVCHLDFDEPTKIRSNTVELIKIKAIELGGPEQFEVDGIKIYSRKYWQEFICLNNG